MITMMMMRSTPAAEPKTTHPITVGPSGVRRPMKRFLAWSIRPPSLTTGVAVVVVVGQSGTPADATHVILSVTFLVAVIVEHPKNRSQRLLPFCLQFWKSTVIAARSMNENPRHRLSIAVVFVWDFIHKLWHACRTAACPVAEIQLVCRVKSAPSQFPAGVTSLNVGCPETKLLESTMSNESDHNMICFCFAFFECAACGSRFVFLFAL